MGSKRSIFNSIALMTLISLAALSSGCATKAPLKENPYYTIKPLSKFTYSVQVKSGQFQHMGCNSGFTITDDSVVIFDTHISEKAMKMVIEDIRSITDKPIKHVVNSHFHGDHVQGNNAFDKSIPIYIHKNAKGQFGIKSAKKRSKTAPEPGVREPSVFLDGDMVIPGSSIKLISLGPAHSNGDIALYNQKDQTLFLGDVLVTGYVGFLHEGHLKEWIASLEKLEKLNPKIVVPGHGPTGDVSSIRFYKNYLAAFVDSAKEHFDAGRDPSQYKLPNKYDHLRARFFLKGNVERAHQLWKAKKL